MVSEELLCSRKSLFLGLKEPPSRTHSEGSLPVFGWLHPWTEPWVLTGQPSPPHHCHSQCTVMKSAQVASLALFCCCCCYFRAIPEAYGGSQARGWMGAVDAGLYHSHSNEGSQPHLRPKPQLMVTPDCWPTERPRNWTCIFMDPSWVHWPLSHKGSSQYILYVYSLMVGSHQNRRKWELRKSLAEPCWSLREKKINNTDVSSLKMSYLGAPVVAQ